jgi:16S rRNA (cytidine1402-2'-O)-methyltransferase
VVATPIGNLDDVSARALRVLREVAVVACEDTRTTAGLAARHAIATPRVSLHAHNEARRVPELLARLERGESIALVCDAGTPLLSDPGARLVGAALERGFRVVPVPGPSAILAALVASGLPAVPFTFLGFPPRRGSARASFFAALRESPGTLVLFEAPHRVKRTLEDLHAALGARRVAVARELTKRFEEIARGRLGAIDLGEPRGEFTLVVEGRLADATEPSLAAPDADALIDAGLAAGRSTREIARSVAAELRIPRSDAYRRVVERSRSARARSRDSGSSPGSRGSD